MGFYIDWECRCKGKNITQDFVESMMEEINDRIGADIYPPTKYSDEEFAFAFNTESFSAYDVVGKIFDRYTKTSPIKIRAYEDYEDGTYYCTNYEDGVHETVEGFVEYPEHKHIIY